MRLSISRMSPPRSAVEMNSAAREYVPFTVILASASSQYRVPSSVLRTP
jgi:hypothetical protein